MSATTNISSLLAQLITETRTDNPNRPALIGIGGAQGSGKSYLCRAFATAHPRIAHFSLDDVYLTRAERVALADEVHPLCITRGPPGTHDLDLADQTIAALEQADAATRTPLPRFDKAHDHRAPENTWPTFTGKPDAILFDGWCVGALAPSPDPTSLNAIEAEDTNRAWRTYTRDLLATDYADFFSAFDALIYLRAPSWEIVRAWRGQQEEETLGRPLSPEENLALDRFVMHYERITRAMLAGYHSAGWIVHLDEERNVTRIEQR
ncbi:kinase [Vitreimonas flagellata]|uniref:kinase n=1 Tax=Vitreimonas flagellata TaxID=2560861 RepID=UPI001074F7F7|nr:kinase [Vitreimonas flagellata]